MSQMIVRPPSLWINPFGNLAEEYSVYVGKPSQDPTQTSSQLTVRDGKGEDASIVMQPIIVTEGVTRNSSGQKILPVIDFQNYSLLYVSANGSRIYSESSFFGDGLSSTGEGGAIAEVTFNNLQQALATDLTGFSYVFVQSEFIGWVGTEAGPTINSLYYYTGQTGSPSTGDGNEWFDSTGNQFKPAKSITEQANADEIAVNAASIISSADALAVDIAANAAGIASAESDAAAAVATANSAESTANSANSAANSANSAAQAAQNTANSNSDDIDNIDDYIEEQSLSGSIKYRKSKDGVIEMWGTVNAGNPSTDYTINFPINFSNTNYVPTYSNVQDQATAISPTHTRSKSTSSMRVRSPNADLSFYIIGN